jgi:hypothetical protein
MLDAGQVEACARYVVDQARTVVAQYGVRPPGSDGETACCTHVQRELEAYCDGAVVMEPFTVSPKAFMGFQYVTGGLFLLALLLYFVSPLLAAGASLLAMIVVVQQLIRYKLLLDPFFPKATSHNVIGRIAPAGPVKRRIILNGHPDAAYEWRWLYRFPGIFPLITGYTLVGQILLALSNFAAAGLYCAGLTAPLHWIGLAQWIAVPAVLLSIGFTTFRFVSPGANDNLSGTFMAVGIAKQLKEAGIRLQHTELMIAITGSEEAGLRGAKAFVARHADGLRDVETIALALDTFRDLDHLVIYSKDLNGTLKHDPAVCQLLKNAGQAKGRDLPYGSIFLGSSDGTAFTQGGMRAAAFAAMDPAPADYYHNRRDTPDNMDLNCLGVAIGIVAEAVRQYDEHGLPAVG